MASRGRGRVMNVGVPRSTTTTATHPPISVTAEEEDDIELDDEDMTEPPSPTENGSDSVPTSNEAPAGTSTLIELKRDKYWLTKGQVVRAVTRCIQAHYSGPYTCWSNTPDEVKKLWWSKFKKRYTWDPEIEDDVRAEYNAIVQRRLKQIVSTAGQALEPPPWLGPEHHKDLRSLRETDEFKAKSARARKNRISDLADEDGKIDPGHRQGSKSTIELAEDLKKKNKGIPPTALDLWLAGHTKKDKNGQKQVVGKKAVQMKEKIDALLEANTEAEIPKNPDQVFFEAAGGWKKGHVPGLGNAASIFYEKPASRSSKSNSHYAPSEIATLRDTVNEYKHEVEETRAKLEEALRQLEEHRKLSVDMTKQFQLMSQAVRENCGSLFTPSQPDSQADVGGDFRSAI